MSGNDKSAVTLIIGGTGMLGRALIESLTSAGLRVVFTYNKNAELAAQISEQYDCHSLALDLKKIDEFDSVISSIEKDYGHITSLIFASGYRFSESIADISSVTEEIWDESHSVEVRGPYFLTRSVALRMKERKTGKVVFIGSVNAVKSLPSPSLYTAHKSAINGIVRSLARELGKHGILINSVDPGILSDGMSNHLSEEVKTEYLKFNCLNRLGKPIDVARAIQWLISEKNSYLIGQSFVLDGGL